MIKIKYNVIGSTTWVGSGTNEYNSLADFMYQNPDVTVDHLEYLRIFKYVNVKKKHRLYDIQYSLVE